MKKKLCAVMAAIIVFGVMTGCSNDTANNDGENTDTSGNSAESSDNSDTTTAASGDVNENSDTTTTVDSASLALPKDIADDVIVASLTNPNEIENPEEFEVTFADFNKEYQFYLNNNGYDDASAEYAAECQEYRANIINFLFTEKIVLREAELLGLGVSSLTEDDFAEINANVDETLSGWYDSFRDDAISALKTEKGIAEDAEETDFYTEEELLEKEKQLTEEYFANSGIIDDDFVIWERNDFIQGKLIDYLLEGIEASDEEADKMVQESINEAKTAFEEDFATYEANSNYGMFYLPEGSRNVEHILFMFSDDDIQEIQAYRNDDNDEKADEIRAEKLEGLFETANDVLTQIKNGADFDELQEQYNQDTGGNTAVYTVIPDSTRWIDGFVDGTFAIENVGDVSELIGTDYGYHIIKYVSDAEITEENLENYRQQAKDYILYNKQNEKISEVQTEWISKYPCTINYEALNLAANTTATE